MPALCAAARPSPTPTSRSNNLLPRSRLGLGPLSERAAIDELGDQVLLAVKLADLVHRDNVRVVQRRGHLRFLLEAATRTAIEQTRRFAGTCCGTPPSGRVMRSCAAQAGRRRPFADIMAPHQAHGH